MKPDRSPVASAISDSSGSFSLKLDTGIFLLEYTCAGYKPFQLIITNDTLSEIPAAWLVRDTTQMAAVTVLGRRPVIERSVDGFTYNAENDMVMAAGSAIDVLRKIPMLAISADGSPSIRGSNNVKVFIDGKPSSVYANSVAEALQQISADEIAKVEIITHPSAKYEAEGTDAVINIITKKRRYNGYNGTLRPYIGNLGQELTGSFKLRSGYWITNLEAGVFFNQLRSINETIRAASHMETANRLEQSRDQDWWQNVQYAQLNIIRIVDSLRTLNFLYRIRNNLGGEEVVQQTALYADDTLATAFRRNIPATYSNIVHTLSAGFTGQSRNKKNDYNLQASWFGHAGRDAYNLEQIREEHIDHRENSKGKTTNSELAFQADLAHNFTQLSKLEMGVRNFWRNSTSITMIDVFNTPQNKFLRDETRSNYFSYVRGVYAGYVSYAFAIKQWQWRGGIRFEHTRLQASFEDTALRIPNFNNIVPNGLIKYNINKTQALTYSYTTRIVRPYLSYLNPNINYIDSLNISYGNPNLESEIIQNQNIEYSYNGPTFFSSVSLVYTHTSRGMEEFRILRPDNITETTFRNIGSSDTWALSTSLRLNKKKFSSGATIVLQHITRSSPALNLTNSGLVAQFNLNATLRFNKGYILESYISFNTRYINLQASGTSYRFYNILLTKKFNDKWAATLRFDNFFDEYFYRTDEINMPTLYQRTRTHSSYRNLRLAISWKFGKQDIRTPVSRSFESND